MGVGEIEMESKNDERERWGASLGPRSPETSHRSGELDSKVDSPDLTLEGAREIVHELRVHELELVMQNEELRQAQHALEVSRRRYQTLYDEAPVGYATLDEKGRLLEANLHLAQMLDVDREPLIRKPIARFIAREDQDIFYLHHKKVVESGTRQTCELRMKRADESTFWTRLESVAVHAGKKKAVALRTTLSDISEERRLRANLALSERMASMGLLAAGVAHEINNPLTFVLINMEAVARDVPRLTRLVSSLARVLNDAIGTRGVVGVAGEDAELIDGKTLATLVQQVNHSVEGARRIAEIARGLGTFSRIDDAQLSLVDLNAAAKQAVAMAESQIRRQSQLETDFGELPLVHATKGKLAQIFVNLLVNATQAIGEGQAKNNRVGLRTWADDEHVFAEVSDSGRGIAEEDLENVFEPFFTTKGPTRGTGLGLAITRRIVDELNGEIHVESTVGEGTRVRIVLPIPKEPKVTSSIPQSRLSGKRGRILVVDDEKVLRDVLERTLEAAHDVVTAPSGLAAQELLRRDQSFDVILCDVIMPEGSGVELHAWLSKNHPQLAKQLVFMSGGIFTPWASEYVRKVSNRLLTKPFRSEELLREVEELVEAAQARSRPTG